jgi:hypothetical protein
LNRRDFFTGVSAAIVAAALPLRGTNLVPRIIPTIVLRKAGGRWLTPLSLIDCVSDLFDQVRAIAPLEPTADEIAGICADIDNALWEIRPVGLQVLFDDMSIEDMARGNFTFTEEGWGTVVITPFKIR